MCLGSWNLAKISENWAWKCIFFQKIEVRSLAGKGLKWWVSGAIPIMIWKGGSWGRHIPILPSNVIPPSVTRMSIFINNKFSFLQYCLVQVWHGEQFSALFCYVPKKSSCNNIGWGVWTCDSTISVTICACVLLNVCLCGFG